MVIFTYQLHRIVTWRTSTCKPFWHYVYKRIHMKKLVIWRNPFRHRRWLKLWTNLTVKTKVLRTLYFFHQFSFSVSFISKKKKIKNGLLKITCVQYILDIHNAFYIYNLWWHRPKRSPLLVNGYLKVFASDGQTNLSQFVILLQVMLSCILSHDFSCLMDFNHYQHRFITQVWPNRNIEFAWQAKHVRYYSCVCVCTRSNTIKRILPMASILYYLTCTWRLVIDIDSYNQ